jgi:3-phenylpropionate/trans-cinnamate dioxygenase ferredoxin reductase subunit
VQHVDKPSYFWSDQYGTRIQFAGAVEPSDEIRFLDGAPADGTFVATYHRGGATTAVQAMNSPRLFTRAVSSQVRPMAPDPVSRAPEHIGPPNT